MTNGDLLLHWLTHVREGSWPTFRRALTAVDPEDEEPGTTARRMRTRLSEMAHVDFFVGGSNRWRTFAPLLGGLCEPSCAVLGGGRTPHLVEALVGSCEKEGCRIEVSEVPDGPDSIRVTGPPEAVAPATDSVGVTYVPNFARALCSVVEQIPAVIGSAPPSAAPTNWSVRSFDLEAMRWVEGLLPDTAYEYRSRHGGLRHYVRGPRRALLQVDRDSAVYAAAYMNRIALLSYEEGPKRLAVPSGAPMPDAMARVAAACLGAPAAHEDGRLVYGGVPTAVAGSLMVAAGQRPPEPNWLSEERRAV